MKKFFAHIVVLFGVLLVCASNVSAIEDISFEITRDKNYIVVNANIIPSQEFINDFQDGLSKNILVTIELFRRWPIIPDEFVKGVQIQKIMLSNPIKGEFIVKNLQGENLIEKIFKDSQEAINCALKINSVKIGPLSTLESGRYYVKITVESNIKKLPSVLEHIIFFVPKYEKKITKESEIFRLP